MSVEYIPAVEKMIAKVMKKKELDRAPAIAYMLAVATGRLAALWRYDDSLPEGKQTKGILTLAGPRKKRAPKSPKIVTLSQLETLTAAKRKPVKRKPAKRKKATKPVKSKVGEQLEIAAAE